MNNISTDIKEQIKEKIQTLIKETSTFISKNIIFYINKNNIVEFYVDKNFANVVMFNEYNWDYFGKIIYGDDYYNCDVSQSMKSIMCNILDEIGIFGFVLYSAQDYDIEEQLLYF